MVKVCDRRASEGWRVPEDLGRRNDKSATAKNIEAQDVRNANENVGDAGRVEVK